MKLTLNEEQREIDMLQKVENRIARRERREKLHRFLIAGLGVLAAGAYFAGRFGHKH